MKITIAGCGNMGLTYAGAFLKNNIVSKENLFLAERKEERREELKKMHIGKITDVSDKEIEGSDIIILAVKPQDFDVLADELKKVITPQNIIISIMAGITISYISQRLGTHKIVRAMPNSPAELGMGMTGYTCGNTLTVDEVRKAGNVLAATGLTIFFEDESMLNAVTALSGSGPAYFFYLVKNMITAGEKMGMDTHTSTALVKQTMLGSFHLLNNSSKSLDELIKAVSSKGGTTEAAFTVFNQLQVGESLQKGIERARDRAKELAK
jgi:pyrroline-5-carboxylate reductase